MKNFLIHTKNGRRDSFIWNMAGSLLLAFQSVIMLMILTRIVGLEQAGIFTIAYANANLFLTIGKYGMRNFQVSDINEQFSFSAYRKSRIITTSAMLVVSFFYVFYSANRNGYTFEKSMVIIWMCLFKVIDVIEDIYHARFQQKNRLDVAGKAMTIRLAITILFFAITLLCSKDLLLSLILSTILTTILFVILTRWSLTIFANVQKQKADSKKVFLLLKVCFPLFLGSFLSFYIGNAPKYAIDSLLNDELQACYGFIAMPVFVIGLLNNFIFSPMIFRFSILWDEKKIREFVKSIFLQISIIVAITIICVFGAYLIGIPVLSFLYNTNLMSYKTELLVLLIGGGFLALSGFLITLITIIRFQKIVIIGYGLVAIMACILSPIMVAKYSITGAAILYLSLMIVLCLLFVITLLVGLLRQRRQVHH